MIEKRQQIHTWYIWKLHSFWSIALLGEPDNITIPTPYTDKSADQEEEKKHCVFFYVCSKHTTPSLDGRSCSPFWKVWPFHRWERLGRRWRNRCYCCCCWMRWRGGTCRCWWGRWRQCRSSESPPCRCRRETRTGIVASPPDEQKSERPPFKQ